MKPENALKADLMMLLVTFLAAAGWVFSKEALQGMPPLLFIGVRFFMAGLLLAVIGWPSLKRQGYRQWRGSLLVGAAFAVALMFWIQGLHHSSHLGEGAFITSLGVVLIPIFATLFFGETPPLSTWLALPVAATGFACLSLDKGLSIEAGQIFFLIAAFLFAIQFNLNTRVAMITPALPLTAIQLLVVGVSSSAVSAATETWPATIAPMILIWLLASTLIATSARFFIQTYAQSLTPASHAAVIMIAEPVWTALLASLWFDERMTQLQLVGCSLIFTALILNRWRWVKLALRTWRH